jgi:hypothetical protein
MEFVLHVHLLLLQVREVIHDFHNSRYATCFAALEALRPVIACDIHLHDHATTLYRCVTRLQNHPHMQFLKGYAISLAALYLLACISLLVCAKLKFKGRYNRSAAVLGLLVLAVLLP